MSARQYDLIREDKSFNLEDQVIRVAVGDELVLEDELYLDSLVSFLHALEHLGVLDCYGCTGDFGVLRVVLHVACMH